MFAWQKLLFLGAQLLFKDIPGTGGIATSAKTDDRRKKRKRNRTKAPVLTDFPARGRYCLCHIPTEVAFKPPPPQTSTYVLKMNVSLAGDVVDNISDVLLSAAADEVLLRSSVLQKDTRTDTQLKPSSKHRSSAISSRLCGASPTCRCPSAGRPSADRCGTALLSDTS